MDAAKRAAFEGELRRMCDAGDVRTATTAAIRGYGPEVLAYLVAMTRTEVAGREVFALWCEHLWRGLAGFRWESSLRNWAYTLARHALSRRAHEPDKRTIPLDERPELLELAEQVHSTTMIHLRTSAKNKLAELRERLDPDDRTLLILRIDRRMPWADIARVMSTDPKSDNELRTFAALLRKRFERAKTRLRKLLDDAQLE